MMTDAPRRREASSRGEHEAAIEIKDLIVNYGKKRAVDGLNMSVPKGSVFGFLGPNGAGKPRSFELVNSLRTNERSKP